MHRILYFFIFVGFIYISNGGEPHKPNEIPPFLVYFNSRHRGLCVGTMISRSAVLTAAVCVLNGTANIFDNRPITVVLGTTYRHSRSGFRVPVVKVLIPKLPRAPGDKGYLVQKSPAILLLKHKVPDSAVRVPVRGILVDHKGEHTPGLKEDCLTAGWHFFYKHDTIYPVSKFLLQRNLRVQFLTVVHKNQWCGALALKIQTALESMGFSGHYNPESSLCLKDTNRRAQPCHGMYGAPLICEGRMVGMLLAPDAQWTNCTGNTVLYHKIHTQLNAKFLACVKGLFVPEYTMDMAAMEYPPFLHDADYMYEIYDDVLGGIGPQENTSEE